MQHQSIDSLRLGKKLVIDRSNGLGSLLDNETYGQFSNLWHLFSRKQKFPLKRKLFISFISKFATGKIKTNSQKQRANLFIQRQ